MRFLVGSDYAREPNAGAAGTIYWTNQTLRELGHEVDEFWASDLPRRIRHGNLHYLLELPAAFRRAAAARCRRKNYDTVILDQPHAFRAGEYLQAFHPEILFLNRTQGWEGHRNEVMAVVDSPLVSQPSPVRTLAQRLMERLVARHQDRVVASADGILAGCSAIPDYLARKYNYPRERVAVIPYGVTGPFFQPAAENPDRWRNLLHVAQFTPSKAPEIVAAIFNRLLRERPGIQAGWVCASQHHEQVRHLIDPAVLPRLRLHAWADQAALAALYDEYGIFLFPSHYEGFGKTPCEAMARGLAVVATRTGGMADLIRDGENGFLREPGDADGLRRQVERLLDDPALAARLGEQARRDMQEMTWTRHARQLAAFAERLGDEKRRGLSRRRV